MDALCASKEAHPLKLCTLVMKYQENIKICKEALLLPLGIGSRTIGYMCEENDIGTTMVVLGISS